MLVREQQDWRLGDLDSDSGGYILRFFSFDLESYFDDSYDTRAVWFDWDSPAPAPSVRVL